MRAHRFVDGLIALSLQQCKAYPTAHATVRGCALQGLCLHDRSMFKDWGTMVWNWLKDRFRSYAQAKCSAVYVLLEYHGFASCGDHALPSAACADIDSACLCVMRLCLQRGMCYICIVELGTRKTGRAAGLRCTSVV